jgi:tetratricopeptide (TPR) repeat protein
VSQSPVSEGDRVGRNYIEAWRDLALRIRDGASFSGHERNKAFLNCGSGASFADVSAAVGLDFADDGRGLAVADWDYDGDVDLWTTNRSAPRVRYSENKSQRDPKRFIAFRLQGDPASGCNRDAIGGSVELLLKNATAARRHVATLRAGDAFLSQSSKWVHFGIPEGAEIAAVEVRWPSIESTVSRYDSIQAGNFYRLSQRGETTIWTPPARANDAAPINASLTETDGTSPSSAIRVRLSEPVVSPPLAYSDVDGKSRELAQGPVLVTLFATWCPNCADQFQALAHSADMIRKAGLKILPLCVDRLDPNFRTTSADVKKHLDKLGFSIAAGWADEDTVQQLDGLQRHLFYRQRPLPLPSAFLFDRAGALSVVYKGNYEVAQLIEDVNLLGAAPDDAKMQALPFSGRTTNEYFVTNPIETAKVFYQGGYPEDARQYLISWLSKNGAPPQGATSEGIQQSNRRAADVHALVGIIEAKMGKKSQAIASFETAIALAPNLRSARLELASLYEAGGAVDKAKAHLEAMMNFNAADPDVLARLGSLLEKQGDPAAAAARYRQALDVQPRSIPALRGLAWLLATTSDPNVRDGTAALALAQILEKSPVRQQVTVLDTIAAAYAASGDFEAAAQRARVALSIAENSGDAGIAARLRSRLDGYLRKKPVLIGE